jgi:hypothetical protein
MSQATRYATKVGIASNTRERFRQMTTQYARLTVIAALLFMALQPAQAQQVRRQYADGLPPIEYDKPYTGELTIVRLTNEAEVLAICTVGKSKRACAKVIDGPPSRCVIIMLTDEKLKIYGDNHPALVMRHELGHCNGWDGDHRGERGPIFTDTHIEMPKLPASTKELPAYPPVVCITPAGKQESCNNRKT